MAHQENKELLDALANCIAECNHCATACLNEQDVKMLTKCIQLDLDCAAICQLTSEFISRGSENAKLMTDACAKVCEACAKECEKHNKMEHCKRCAEACRQCADLCKRSEVVTGNGQHTR